MAKFDYFVNMLEFLDQISLVSVFDICDGKYTLKLTELTFPTQQEKETDIDGLKLYFFIYSITEFLKDFGKVKGTKIIFSDNNQLLAKGLDKELAQNWPSREKFLEFIMNQGSWKYVLITTFLFHKGISYFDTELQKNLTLSFFKDDEIVIKNVVEKNFQQ